MSPHQLGGYPPCESDRDGGVLDRALFAHAVQSFVELNLSHARTLMGRVAARPRNVRLRISSNGSPIVVGAMPEDGLAPTTDVAPGEPHSPKSEPTARSRSGSSSVPIEGTVATVVFGQSAGLRPSTQRVRYVNRLGQEHDLGCTSAETP